MYKHIAQVLHIHMDLKMKMHMYIQKSMHMHTYKFQTNTNTTNLCYVNAIYTSQLESKTKHRFWNAMSERAATCLKMIADASLKITTNQECNIGAHKNNIKHNNLTSSENTCASCCANEYVLFCVCKAGFLIIKTHQT